MALNALNEKYLEFALPAKVEFGPGKFQTLPQILTSNNLNRVAFVVDPGRKQSGILDGPIKAMQQQSVDVTDFDGVVENPDVTSVRECIRFLRDYQPDVVIGVGGGSSLDTAKAAAGCYANGLDDVMEIARGQRLTQRAFPTILIPTTSGSGTEINFWSVISDHEAHEKVSVGDPMMAPYMAVVDPELTYSMPPKLTLWSGVDAVTHVVEAYLSSAGNWLSDMFCLGSISLSLKSLNRAVEQGDSLRARGNMALASLLAGAAMQNVGLGLVHAMSHQVSGFYDTPHGMTNALLLPHVLRFNAPKCESKMRTINGLVQGNRGLITWLDKLAKKHDIRKDLIEIREADIPTMAERAWGNVNAQTNPRTPDRSDIEQLYRKSFQVI